ncbi:flagellar assembly protein T N-terminal domain-containing protein [Alteromonas lipolytica]|uniref:DUF4384 domain-containing protein n=1 Tax=Alteromonas lipolytica TaxID=1856405 RepID=A0A1E8FJY1_9ALTE|nr:flagellar assembly protein T N-terminal domain-containing protein [Alteromonas lipolytica]OFI35743.1 hypothetical protein BFC17_10680 [Alteromonas lipolytica]GGF80411.1 hypothetical protein GCM10011338_35830 [Alteromonas lipolytica]
MANKTMAMCAFLSVLVSQSAVAAYSSIVEARGMSCDSSSGDAGLMQLALTDARRNAAETVQTSVDSYSKVENYAVVEDLIKSYSNASVQTLQVLSQQRDEGCLTVTIRAEVTPEKNIDQQFVSEELLADPTIPLTVKLWLSKNQYAVGEQVRIYIKANKPFFGRLVYTMLDGTKVQLLPNPYRSEHHFQGQVLYQVPDANDDFLLEVTPPLGAEQLTLYASTHPLGELAKTSASGMYLLNNNPSVAEVGQRTRGIKIKAAAPPTAQATSPAKQVDVAEFAEVSTKVMITL